MAFRRRRNEFEIARMNGDRVISVGSYADPDQWSEFVVRFDEAAYNVQIDPSWVEVGDKLLVALKSEVLVGSIRSRLIAVYNTMTVHSPENCESDGLMHSLTICTDCIKGSWTWDYLFRKIPSFQHGTLSAYLTYGCRCDTCIDFVSDHNNKK